MVILGEDRINNKNLLINFTILILLFLFLLLSGCVNDSNSEMNKFIGKWEWSDTIQDYEFTFYENGSFYSYYVNHANNETHKGWGEYSVLDDSKVRLYTSHGYGGMSDDKTYEYLFSDDDTKVTLTIDNLSIMTLTKKES